jgi:hypothetical protein
MSSVAFTAALRLFYHEPFGGRTGGRPALDFATFTVQAHCNSTATLLRKLQPFIHVPYFFSDAFDLSYEFWGDATGYDEVVYRGNLYEKRFSVRRLKKQTLFIHMVLPCPSMHGLPEPVHRRSF